MCAVIGVCRGHSLATKCLKLAATNNQVRLDKEQNPLKKYNFFNFAATSQPYFLMDFYFPPTSEGESPKLVGLV